MDEQKEIAKLRQLVEDLRGDLAYFHATYDTRDLDALGAFLRNSEYYHTGTDTEGERLALWFNAQAGEWVVDDITGIEIPNSPLAQGRTIVWVLEVALHRDSYVRGEDGKYTLIQDADE